MEKEVGGGVTKELGMKVELGSTYGACEVPGLLYEVE